MSRTVSVEDGVSTMEAEFPLAEGIGGKFDNTLEMAGRVPGKLKLSPGLNFPSRNLNSPHPFAWRVQLAQEYCITFVPADHFHCRWPRPVSTSYPFTSCLYVPSFSFPVSPLPFSASTSCLYFLPVSPLLTCILTCHSMPWAWLRSPDPSWSQPRQTWPLI